MAIPKALASIKRFGPRYGRTVKHKLGAIEAIKKAKSKCPYCSAVRVKKIAAGIFNCNKCNSKFTARAYDTQIKKSISTIEEENSKSELVVKSKKSTKREARKQFDKEKIEQED